MVTYTKKAETTQLALFDRAARIPKDVEAVYAKMPKKQGGVLLSVAHLSRPSGPREMP
ncbi:hypothetical protein [Ruegeria profundi]|uniref:hypothetical protein n=1 Tax=Ruegeria profundi TaxID=1685378 RepID=UPI000A409D90|nr:hypothetical protein [Ruegeria profundi]